LSLDLCTRAVGVVVFVVDLDSGHLRVL
jgi:hypothetical protein